MSKPHRKMQSLILPAATCFLLLSLQAVPTPAQPNSLVLAGERLFVLCGDPVRLFEVSAFDGRVLKELPVPAGFQPTGAGGLALNRLELFLTSGGGQIYTIDSRDGHLIRTLDIFDPVEVNFLEVSGLAHVPGQGLLVSSSTPVLPSVYLSPDDGSFRRRLPGAQRLHGLGAGPLSRLFAWNTAENGIEEVDEISGDRVAFTAGDTIFAEGATGLAYSGRHLFLSGAGNDVIKIVDPRANTVVRAFPAPRTPVYGLASAPEEPSIVFLRSDRFPFFLSGAFRERSGVIEKGEVFVYPEGADPALADRVFSFDYPGEFSSEVFSASLEEADFPSDRGVFTFYGIGTGIDGATTPLQEALRHTVTVVLDSLPPFAQIGEPASGSVLTPNDYRDGTTAFSVIGWVTDTPAGLRGVEFLVQRADWTDPRVAGFMNLNGQPSALVDFIWDPQQDGDYEIWLHAMDRSGNEGASVRHSVSVDRNPIPTPIPGIPIPTDAEILFASPPLEVFSTVAMAELDGDLDPELVFGTDKTGGEDTGAGLYAINLDGSTVAGLWPILLDVDVRSSPAVADLDGDGLDEVVVGTYGPPSTILIFDNDGSPMGSADSRLSVISSPAIGNLDDDPALEIVVGTSDGTLLALESDGTPLNPAWPVELPRRQPPYLVDRNDVDSSPALGDLDGDGVPEIVALSDDGVVYAYHADGTPVAGFPFAAPRETFHHPVLTSSNSASPILADVEGDGRIDVVAALSNGRVYALSGDGTMLNGFPLRFPPTAPADTPAEEGDEILSTPAVGDVDGDGLLELAVAFYSGQADESRLYVYDLTGPAHGPAMAWPMFQHDGPRKGFFPNAPGGDANHDGNVDDRDNSAFVLSWYRHATMPRFQPAFDFNWSRRIDGFDLNAYLGIQQGHPAPPFVPPTLPSTATATPTGATGEPVVTPTATETPIPPPEITATFTNTPVVVPTPTATHTPLPGEATATPTPTRILGTEIFREGDAHIDFSVFPDGSPVNGVVTNSFTPGTYLTDQFASVGVTFRSTQFGAQVLTGIGCAVIGGPSNNRVHGMRHAPPMGMDGRTVFELEFDEAVERAGVLRRGGVNLASASAVTNFFDLSGNLIDSIVTTVDNTFVGLEIPEGSPGIKRIEITSTEPYPTYGAGYIDDLHFSPVGSLPIPEPLRFVPFP